MSQLNHTSNVSLHYLVKYLCQKTTMLELPCSLLCVLLKDELARNLMYGRQQLL